MIFADITASFGLMDQPIQVFTIKVFIPISPRYMKNYKRYK